MKKKYLLFSVLLLAALLALMPLGCTRPPDNGEEEEEQIDPTWAKYYTYWYENLGKTVMPIGAWIAPPPAVPIHGIPEGMNTAEAYADVAESGINAIYGLYEHLPDNREDIMNALGYAEDNNIVYFLRDRNLNNFIELPNAQKASYAPIVNHKGFGGVLAKDEPGLVEYDLLGEIHSSFKEAFKDAESNPLYYINMMPSYASKNQLEKGAAIGGGGAASAALYEQYIDEYIEKVQPEIYSYDFYPMEGVFPSMVSTYFSDLVLVRQKTLDAEIPFWTFIQACSWGNHVRICTQSEIDYQVNTSLAFGAKGIQYFTYWTAYDDAGTSPGFYPSRSNEAIGAMVSAQGVKQPMYYKVQKTNLQVRAAGEYLLHSASFGVMQHGATPAPIPAEVKLQSFRELTSAGGSDAIIGCFEYKGRTLLYVLSNSIEEGGEITLNFNREVDALTVQGGVAGSQKGNSLDFTLAAGEGVLVLLDAPAE